MNRVLITGASGQVGRHVVSQLLSTGVRVRAMSRNPDSAGLPLEVEVVRGDLTAPETLDDCLDGVDSVFLLWSAPGATAPAAIERIAKHARRIVFLSSPHQNPHPFFQKPQPNAAATLHKEIERLIKASGLAWTFVRPGIFAANARSWWRQQIRDGDVVRWPYALALTAPTHEHDIAAVAVRAMCDDGHAGAEYVVTGPQSLSQRDQVSTIGDVLGRSLRFDEITPDEAQRELMAIIPAPAVIDMLLAAWSGALDQPALVTTAVADVTGLPPRTFRDWATENAAAFQRNSG